MTYSFSTDLGLGGSLFACALELFMAGHDNDLRLLRTIVEFEQHLGGLEDCCVPPTHWINHLQPQHRWGSVGSGGVDWGLVELVWVRWDCVGSGRVKWGCVEFGWGQVGLRGVR